MSDDFFKEQLPASKIKTAIVVGYFRGWTKIIGKYSNELGYLDFFSGPGKYEDGTDSTPLLILKSAINDPSLVSSLKTVFNDIDKENVEKLKKEIEGLEDVKKLKYAPIVNNDLVGGAIIEQMQEVEIIPSFIFIDPWGYKGLSLELIASVIKDWGCDCIFFFNYNRINAALTNPAMKDNVNSIFGVETADRLRKQVKGLSPTEREKLILEEFMDSLKTIKGKYSISFKFYMEEKEKTSHFLIFVTKNPLGYHLMKEIMSGSCDTDDEIPTYEYNPWRNMEAIQIDLFKGFEGQMDKLCDDLCKNYSGKTMTMDVLYKDHNLNKPYIKANYKTALLRLEQQNRIITEPPKDKRRFMNGKLTMGDAVKVTFK